jgi:signal transduction histidine kinase
MVMIRTNYSRLAVVALSLIAFSLFIADLGLRIFSPSDGVRLRLSYPWQSDGVVLSTFQEGASGLQEGDVVVAVDGHSLEDLVRSLFDFGIERPEWRVGQIVDYRVKRGGELLEIPIRLGNYPVSAAYGQVWGTIFTVLSIFLIAVFVFVKRPSDPSAQVLLLAGACVLGGLTWSLGLDVSGIVNKNGFWLNAVLTRVVGILGWVAFVHFALVFPKPQPILSRRRWFLPVLYGLPYLLIGSYSLMVRDQASSALEWIGRIDTALSPLELVFSLTFLIAMVWSFRSARDPIGRHQVRWISYAFIAMVILYVFLMAIPEMISGAPLVDYNALGPMSLIIMISFAFAILRYRLFDIDLIINRTLVYGPLTAGVVGLYVVIVAVSGAVLLTSSNLIGLLLATLLMVLIVKPIHSYLQRGADRLMPVEIHGLAESLASDIPRQNESHRKQAEREGNRGAGTTALPPMPVEKRWSVRVVWHLAIIAATGLFIASIPGYVPLFTKGFIEPRFVANPSPLVTALNVAGGLISIATVLLCLFLATMLYRHSNNGRMALILSFYLMVYGLVMAGPVELLGFYLPGFDLIAQVAVMPLIFPLSFTILALLPDGHFVPRWNKWVVLGSFVFLPLALAINPALTRMSRSLSNSLILILAVMTFLLAVGVSISLLHGQIYRYRNVSTHQQKQQIKWVAYGFGLFFAIQMLTGITWVLSFSLPPTTPFPLWMAAVSVVWFLSIAIIPTSLSIAVMRYQLWDIDIIINRTLVYGGLSVVIVGLYALLVGGLGTLFQVQGNLLIALLATGLVAVLFQPLRARLQRGVNRLVFGERDDPLAALSSLGRQLETATTPEEVLPTLVRTIARTLKLPYVAISLRKNGEIETVAEFGKPVIEVISLPLAYQGERVGQLLVTPRSPSEPFSTTEMQLLSNIARQAGAAAHAVRLTADLQRSREHLVTTREEERRRLRRDLHDGLGPTLAGQTLKLDAALDLVEKDPAAARSLLLDMKSQTQDTVTRIRRLVYDLRPPALDDLGLAGALQAHIYQMEGATNGLRISLDIPDGDLPPLAAAVEVAAYRIAQEGLTNIVRHAQAKECQLRLSLLGGDIQALHLEIIDDGIGLPRQHRPGVGMNSMHERAAELGGTCVIEPGTSGGTRVLACLPIRHLRLS